MALDNGEQGGEFVGRDYWLQLAKEGALVAFRVLVVEEPTVLSVGMKEAEPVVVDFVVLNGSELGTVYRKERVIANGIVNTLRTKTVTGPTGKKIKVAREPGSDVAVRMGIYKSFGREHPGANPCGPDEFEKVKAIFGQTGGDPYSHYERLAMASIAVESGDNGQPDNAADDDGMPF
jgi:hypothetical protein